MSSAKIHYTLLGEIQSGEHRVRYLILFLTLFLSLQTLALRPNQEVEDILKDDYLMSPLSKYMTRENYEEMHAHDLEVDKKSRLMKGKLITINTQDSEACEEIRTQLKIKENICYYDPKAPLVSVLVMKESNVYEFEHSVNFSELSSKTQTSIREVRNLTVMGVAMFGVIYSLPESISKWDKSKGFRDVVSKYDENIKNGPVWDQDDWAVNYIGHPVSGAAYYTLLRHQGFTWRESFTFSVLMSTFFWEYGIECFAEIPSIQDLIVTPIIGSLMGEMFYQWQQKIDANDGKLLGSNFLGKTAAVLMNPAGAMSKKINKWLHFEFIKDEQFYISNRRPTLDLPFMPNEDDMIYTRYLGAGIRFLF